MSAVRLSLVRVQPSETAARGRHLVRFITDLVQRADKPIPVVAECEHCGEFYNVSVDITDEQKPLVYGLPGNCRRCLTPMDTPAMIEALAGNARYLAETATPLRVS